MGIYHFSVKIIGRNTGRSAVASAAYRAGECLTNQYDGITHDYTKKKWVEFEKVLLPENAPKEYANREILWNAVEAVEKSSDAQLAREFELALPVEFTKEQQIEIVQQFVKENLISQGMIADIAIHCPPVTNDRHQPIDINGCPTNDESKMQFINPHAHIMATMRPMDAQGKWEAKTQIEYLCKRGSDEQAFTASEFKIAKSHGWEKQYRFIQDKKKIWMTMSEGQALGLKRISRAPRSTPYGRDNPKVAYWGDKSRIFEWRQHWQDIVNAKFESIQSEVRIDCRSYRDQGRVDEIPTIHMGTSAAQMEKRADREIHEGKSEAEVVRSDIGDINRQISEHNQFVYAFKARLSSMVENAKSFIQEIAEKLEIIRAQMIGNSYEQSMITSQLKALDTQINDEQERLSKYCSEVMRIRKLNDASARRIKEMKAEMLLCEPYQFKLKKKLQNQINEEQKRIEDREEYIRNIMTVYGYHFTEEIRTSQNTIKQNQMELQVLNETVSTLQSNNDELIAEYIRDYKTVGALNIEDDIENEQLIIRPAIETNIMSKMKNQYGNKFSVKRFKMSMKDADLLLRKKGSKKTEIIKKAHIHK
ncbi:MAG: MobA/MobL family protein [Lachnospiraceae bacterium]|nr:MobA/MobL family protein [Lachnospiraceae bacterium]